MASRWFTLFFGVALIQGFLALSPIPVPEDEWAEFARMLRDPAYRLPDTTRPRHYEVTITPYFDTPPTNVDPFTFDGEVTIYTSPVVADLTEIIMHCNDLTIQSVSVQLNGVEIATPNQTPVCEMPYSFLRISTSQVLQLNQEYVIRITYRGNLQTNMRGFYRSWYNDSVGRRWMGTTQFQPGHARQAFPCYDEPVFKATFDITIVRDADFSPTISNMPIRTNATLGNGRISETFHTTPLTSTYLLAFIISHYSRVSSNNDEVRPFHIYARDNVGTNGDWSLEVGESLMDKMDEVTAVPYYEMAPYIEAKQAAIPDFSAGAMENWGLMTYREALILYDPLNSNHFYKQRIANIIGHEVAHMWFGNLVTCAWWDNLWLNEAFGRFYQFFLPEMVIPELGFHVRFVVEQLQTVMISDSSDNAHALTNPDVNDPVSVSAHFSAITYAKGATMLRMTQHLLTEETFVKGLRKYLQARRFDVAEPHHLFDALDEAAAEDGALDGYGGITISSYFSTWSVKAGHPLLTVNIDQRTGRMLVTQARWELTTGVSQHPSLWEVPITWTRGGAPDFENTKPSQVLTMQATAIERGTQGNEWVIFNKQETGYYRLDYDDTNWALLTRALRSNQRTVIHELNRAQIVDDLLAFARAGVKTYQRSLNILSFLESEDAYAPWISAINGFNFALRRLAPDPENLQKFQDLIIQLSTAVTARLGYAERDYETFMDGLLRMYVLTFLCDNGHPQCVAAGIENFQRWRNGTFIPANMRPWVYCTGLRHGTADDYNYLWSRYLAEDLATEKLVLMEAAGCTSDQASLESFLDAIVFGNDTIRPQDHSTALNRAVGGNEFNTLRMFEWLTNNVQQTTEVLGSIATPLSLITGRLLNEEQIAMVQTWLDANRDTIGTAYTTGINGIATTRANLQWSANRIPEFERYFEVGYVEDVIEEVTDVEEEDNVDGGGEEETEEPEVEEDTDGGANISAISLITILVTVAINFMV